MGDPLLVRSGNMLRPTPLALPLRSALRLGPTELAGVLRHEAHLDRQARAPNLADRGRLLRDGEHGQ